MTENHDVLSQYGSISIDDKIIEALKVGLHDEKNLLSSLGMQPEGYTQYSWWFEPWTKDQNYPTFQLVDKVVDDSPPSHSNSIFQSSSSSIFNVCESQTMES